jgi:formimidoylglutamate deiminase
VTTAQVIAADLTWTGDAFEPNIRVAVGDDGRILRVGRLKREPTLVLAGRALIPGFVNSHSHAFQRALRGQGERFPAGPGSFWTWREAMYALVERIGPEEFLRTTTRAFLEMRASGITSVGEFHYLHHAPGTRDFGFDRLVIRAARRAGIRLVLLVTYYRTGGIGQPLEPPQSRFETPDPATYWAHMDALARDLHPHETLGAVVHSIRAASLDDLAAVHAESLRRRMVFHIHVEEQRREIEEARIRYGRTPMAALLGAIETAEHVTAVHCTHTSPADADAFLTSGGRICVCPLTEANLGDGIPDLENVPLERLCLGTDSNARIDMFEEMRWLEYGQRLRRQARGALVDEAGHAARPLFFTATTGGADALGLETGRIAQGQWADFATIDLAHPTLAGATADTLLEALVFGAGADCVRATCVGGRWSEGEA